MGIIQFLRIIWARSLLIAACTVFTFLGALVVTLIVQPRYEAVSRVMLALLKPDPVTGNGIQTQTVGPYVETQRELVKDYQVTSPVVDALGWLTDPGRIAAYQKRPAADTRDFRRWLSQQVADRTSAKLASGTIFEITFQSNSPLEAKVGAETLRQAYMDYTLEARRQEATRSARFFQSQAQAARNLADTAELAKAAFERENGIVMQGDNASAMQDIDSTRLNALVSQAAVAPSAGQTVTVSSQASLQLAAIDSEIAQNSAKLGPNHPEMLELKQRRALIAAVAAKEEAAAKAGNGNAAAVAALTQAVQEQKSRVVSQRDKVERLRQLQSEVELRREQYKKTAERAAELSLEAGVADSGLSPLGVVVTPSKPAFPNKPLILGGSFGLGGALGLVLALLVELLNRRVRGLEDMDLGGDFNCLAVINSARSPQKKAPRVSMPKEGSAPSGAAA